MKSIERRFKNLEASNPGWSTYTCFAEAISGQGFGEQTIGRWFNKLVDKNDYSSSDKKDVLKHLVNLSKMAEGDKK
ncbi:MAG: hypothetical protein WC564_00315 [Patescibacteria group bacterium]